MLGILKKTFVGLLISVVNSFNHTKCVSWSNQKCTIQLTLIDLYPNEYTQKSHHYPPVIKLDRCVGSCNILNELSNKVCDPNKTVDLNLNVFNTITGINEWKT